MQEDNIVSQVSDNPETNYLDTIKELKENSVSKSDYDKVVAENKRLLNDYINGKTPNVENVEPKPTTAELRKKFLTEFDSMSNLEHAKTYVALRENVMAETGLDPTAGTNPSDEDKAQAQKLADVLNECIDIAQDDPVVFQNELNRRIVDSPFAKIRRK